MKEKNKEYITPMPVLVTITVVLAILTILNFVMMLKAINEKIATEKAYQISAEEMFFEEMSEVFEQLLEDNKDLKKQIDLLQNTSMYTEKEDYIESLVSYFNEQEEMEFMIYLYNNYPEIFYDILSFYMTAE